MQSISLNLKDRIHLDRILYVVILSMIIMGLLLIYGYSFLLFHSLVEIFSVVIGFGLFILTWNARRFMANESFKIIGIGYASIAAIDLMHALAYPGMSVFHVQSANLATQLWIAAGLLQALVLGITPLFVKRKLNLRVVFACCAAAVTILLAAIFSGHFPDCYIQGHGLTHFKIFSEYVIIAILIAAAYLFTKRRQYFSDKVFRPIILSIVCTGLAEFFFTEYIGVYDFANVIGHFAKLAAFYLIYQAILVAGLKDPFKLTFRELKQTEERLRAAHDSLEATVVRRTAELKASEEKYRALIDCASDAVFVNEVKDDGSFGPFIEVNEIACTTLGYERDELSAKTLMDLTDPRCKDRVAEAVKRILNDKRAVFECSLATKAGRSIPVEISSAELQIEDSWVVISLVRDFTQRRLVEEGLRKSEHHLKEAQRLARIGSWDWDARTDAISWSEEYYHIYGMDPNQAPPGYEEHLNAYTPESAARLDAVVKKNMETGEPYEIDLELAAPGGQCRWVTARSETKRDENGEIIGLCGTAQDITDRKLTEEAIRAMSVELQTIYNNTFTLLAYLDKNFNFVRVNRAFAIADGRPADFFDGKNYFELYPDAENEATFRRVVATGQPFSAQSRPYESPDHPKRGVVYRDLTLVPVFDNNRRVSGLILTQLDVSERKRAEERLRLASENWERTFDAVPDFIFVADNEGTILRVNKAMCNWLNMTAEHIQGERCCKLMHQLDKSPKECPRLKLMRDGRGHSCEITSYSFGGCFAVHVAPIRDANGTLVGSVHVARDITETKRLQELEARAQRLDTAGRIAGEVAHDFNNLLAPITAYPEMIREVLPPESPALEFVNIIEEAGDRIADINQQLLTLSRRSHYSQEVVNLNTIISQAASDLGLLAGDTACKINLCEDLPNIRGGPAQLHRMILNLLVNARDAVGAGGTIAVKTENIYVDETAVNYNRVPKGEFVKLTVSDTGVGIPEEVINKIFDPFFTTKSANKKRGSGLGLSVVDAVVKDHGGYLDLTSEIGKGTSFYIYFPVTHESRDEHDDSIIPRGSETVMVVDDDAVQRDVMNKLLSSLGYKVTTCESGEKALEELKRREYNLMILDMIMPDGMSGVETYRKVLELYPGQRAIIVSGFSESDQVREAQALGAGEFVRKPLNRTVLANAVRNELDKILEGNHS